MGDMSKAQQRQSSRNKVRRDLRRGLQITERNKVFNILRDVKRQEPTAFVMFKNATAIIIGVRVFGEHADALNKIGAKTGIARLKQFINACSGAGAHSSLAA